MSPEVAPPEDSANTTNLAMFAESGGATASSTDSEAMVAPPDSANTANLAVFAESGGAIDKELH